MAQSNGKENLLILGPTGYIGAYITEQIVNAKHYFGRIAIFTSPNTVQNKAQTLDELRARGVEVILGDVKNSDDLLQAFQGIDTVISAVGRNVISNKSIGSNLRHKLPRQLRDLDYTYVVTGPYADARAYLSPGHASPEIGSFNVKAKTAVLLGDGRGKISLTTPPDVGKLVVKALIHPKISRNLALRVNSFTTTPSEIVAEFEKQTGGEKWTVSYTSLEKARELEKQAYAEGNPRAECFTLRRIWGEGGTLYEERDNGFIEGEDTETLEDAVGAAIAAQSFS